MAKIISKTISCPFCDGVALFSETKRMHFSRWENPKREMVNWYSCSCPQKKFFRFVKLDSNVSRETSQKLKK